VDAARHQPRMLMDCMVSCKEKIFAIDVTGDISICNCNTSAGAPPTMTLVASLSVPKNVCNCSFTTRKSVKNTRYKLKTLGTD
jgi:hypothetical protein